MINRSSLSLCATEQLAILEKVKVIFWLVKFGLCIRPTHRMEKASLQYGILLFRISSLSLSLCRTIWGCLQGEGNGIAQYAGGVDIRREEGTDRGREGQSISVWQKKKGGRGEAMSRACYLPKRKKTTAEPLQNTQGASFVVFFS